MTYNLTYAGDIYKGLMWGVVADSRANIPAVKNQNGWIVKSFVDSQTALVVPGVIPYAISTESGSLAGYVGISVDPGPVFIAFQQLRPAFVQFSAEISNAIANFITSGSFAYDTLN
jgi:hypothetical protein